MCEIILTEENITYETLEIEKYVEELSDYWNENQPVFKLDSVSFLYIWGSFVMWDVLAVLCHHSLSASSDSLCKDSN